MPINKILGINTTSFFGNTESVKRSNEQVNPALVGFGNYFPSGTGELSPCVKSDILAQKFDMYM